MPAGNGDVTVKIAADTSDLNRSMREATNSVNAVTQDLQGMGREFGQMAREMGTSTATVRQAMTSISPEAQAMKATMRDAFLTQARGMQGFRDEMVKTRFGFFQLTQGAKTWTGSNAEFMSSVAALGKQHKATTDSMLKNNELAKMSIITTVGTMLARSTQSEKIAQNYDRMNNPLYKTSNALLAITGRMEGMAKAGMPAALALKMLGPTANMKALSDQIKLINAGIMRYQMVALVATIGAGMFYGALHNGAMENATYAASFNGMIANLKDAFKPVMDAFIAIMPHVFNFIGAIAKLMAQFNQAHPIIAKVVGVFLLIIPALLAIMAPLSIGIGMVGGMAAAFSSLWVIIGPLVVGFGALLGPVAAVAAIIAAVGVAAWLLYKNWDKVVGFLRTIWAGIVSWATSLWQGFMDFIKGLWSTYIGIYIAIWNVLKAGIMAVWNAIKAVVMAVVGAIVSGVQGYFTLLSNTITGIWNGIKNIIMGVWTIIKNIVLGAVLLIVDLVTGNFSGLRDHAIQIWNNIKGGIGQVWAGIKGIVGAAIGYVKGIVTGAWNVIRGVTSAVWNGIKGLLSGAWSGIKSTISGGITAVKTFISSGWTSALSFTRNFGSNVVSTITGAWTRMKTAVSSGITGAVNFIKNGWNGALKFLKGINLADIGRNIISGLANGIKSGIASVKSAVTDATSAITGKIKGILGIHSPSRYMRDEIGWNIGLGLARGIEQTRNLVARATDSMTLAAIPSVPGASVASGLGFTGRNANGPQNGTLGASGGIVIQQMNVRNDQDIERVAQRLADLQSRSLRAEGRV